MTPLDDEIRWRVRAEVHRRLWWLLAAMLAAGVVAGYTLGVVWTRAWQAGLSELAR